MEILGCKLFESKEYFFVERKNNLPQVSTTNLGCFS
jgi:hypothetical protein